MNLDINFEKDVKKYEQIAEQSESFYKNTEHVRIKDKTYRFDIYNYRLADVEDFAKFSPVSFEMRGVTFDENGSAFLSIHKIFNHRENRLVENDIADEIEIREKIDGSLIQPVLVKDEILCKTKSTFHSEQALKAKEIVDSNENLQKFILDCFNMYGMMPLFEYTGYDNQIVVYYPERELTLIQMRYLDTGKYADYQTLSKLAQQYGIKYVKAFESTFESILKERETLENIEGWVVQSVSGKRYTDFRKIKTLWYLNLHRIMACDKISEDTIIELVLDEKIDDVLSSLSSQNSRKRDYIENITHALNHFLKEKTDEIEHICETEHKIFEESPKTFVEKYKNHELFPILMKSVRNSLNTSDITDELKKFVKKRTNKLTDARAFIENVLNVKL